MHTSGKSQRPLVTILMQIVESRLIPKLSDTLCICMSLDRNVDFRQLLKERTEKNALHASSLKFTRLCNLSAKLHTYNHSSIVYSIMFWRGNANPDTVKARFLYILCQIFKDRLLKPHLLSFCISIKVEQLRSFMILIKCAPGPDFVLKMHSTSI